MNLFQLKGAWLVPPLISLAIVYTWLPTSESHRDSGEKGRSTPSKKSSQRSRSSNGPSFKAAQPTLDPATAEWKQVAMVWDRSSMETKLEIRKRIDALSSDEIIAALGEAEMEIQGDPGMRLQSLLCGSLEKRDPMRLLEHFRPRLGDPSLDFGLRCILQSALTNLTAKSPQIAVDWLNQVIEEGRLDSSGTDSTNQQWLGLETGLFNGLVSEHSDLAEKRLSELPYRLRHSVLTREGLFLLSKPPAVQITQAGLCRKFLNEDDNLEFVRSMSEHTAFMAGLSSASMMLNRISATPKERAQLASGITNKHLEYLSRVRHVTLADVETMRQWAGSQGLSDVEPLTGDALGHLAGQSYFGVDRAFEEIMKYHAKNPNDQLLAEFLGWPAVWVDQQRCLDLANRISNERLRKESSRKP